MFRQLLDSVAFLLGLTAVCFIGAGYVGSNLLALTVTLLIAIGYLAGALELLRYRRATAALARNISALSEAPPRLEDWLAPLDPSLRPAVRQRIEGHRVPLPGPALTPYLVGLLVLLGMMGTLLGMMAMLRGTGLALETAADLQAVRDSLAAPVKGLGFAFGTSIAGVATSAMLGLLSALCRGDRLRVVQALDTKIATTLRVHSQAHQRDEAFKLLQRQTELMPALIDRLQAMMTALEQQGLSANERHAAQQEAFHARTEATYTQLAASVEQSLRKSISDSVSAASDALQPVMAATMDAIAQKTAALHDTVTLAVDRQLQALSGGLESTTRDISTLWNGALAEQQASNRTLVHDLRGAMDQFGATFAQRSTDLLDGVSARLDATTGHVAEAWNHALSRQQDVNAALSERNQAALAAATTAFEQQSASLLRTVDASHATLQQGLAEQDQQRLAAWTASLAAMAAALREEWAQAGTDVARRQQEICDTLAQTAREITAQSETHARQTIAEIGQLMQAASEAPRAAAEVIAELRQKLSDSMARDNAMLDERSRILGTLDTLLGAVNAGAGTMVEVSAQLNGSALEVASLGESFGQAVGQFSESNDKLGAQLQRIEGALGQSMARSDEQLAYYVAQAREVIDLSVSSQKQIVENMQQLAAAQRALAGTDA